MFPWRPNAILPGLCLALALSGAFLPARAADTPAVPDSAGTRAPEAPPQRAQASASASIAPPVSALPGRPRSETPDPVLAAVLGALPLVSGFYLTSAPVKGAVFTLADAMLLGTIAMIRSDKNTPSKDAAVYFYLLGAVNVADLALSLAQVRSDAAARLSVTLNPPDRPGFLLGWRF